MEGARSRLATVSTARMGTLGEVVGAFESETAAVLLRTSPRSQHNFLYALIAMLVVCIALSAVVKLDRVVVSTGRTVPTAGTLYISPVDTGIVKQVNVKAGDVVKKGQTLATLDPTFTRADVAQLEQKFSSDSAANARLDAELAGKPYLPEGKSPAEKLQAQLWQQRRDEYRSNLLDFDGRIHAVQAQLAQADSDSKQYAKRLGVAQGVENLYAPLLDKGYVSKLQMMQATDERMEVGRLAADADNQKSLMGHNIASLQAQREAFLQKWHADTESELVTTRTDLEQTRQSLEKARRLSALGSLESPTDAVVLKVAKVSSGSVTSGANQSGQEPLFTLVPIDAQEEADVNISAGDIGFIKVGDPVQLKLDAYRYMEHGTAKGVIKTISEGSFTVDDNNVPVIPYFKVRVVITDIKLRNVPANFRLIPGMTLTGDIMVGRRTILSYLLEGSLRTGAEAMREP
jgi:hemolysin D